MALVTTGVLTEPPPRGQMLLDRLEWAMAVLALSVVPALILEDSGTTPVIRSIAYAVNWFVWLVRPSGR